MPRGIELPIPFPSRVSPDLARADDVHVRWPARFGLIADPAAAERHTRARYADLSARFHPTAIGRDLDLAVDLNSWFFLFDDLFDGPAGHDPKLAAQLVHRVTRVLDHPADDWCFAAAFADLWTRSRAGMSRTWQSRAARHWRDYLAGHITEARHRHGRPPTAAEHLRLRRDSIGVLPTLDLAERVGHFEVPPALLASPELTELCEITTEVIVIHNDLCSVEKEEAIDDIHNLILILQRERDWNRHQTVTAIITMIQDRTDRFVRLAASLPAVYDRLALDPAGRAAGDRYLRDALTTLMRGAYDWAENSGRYTVLSTASAG